MIHTHTHTTPTDKVYVIADNAIESEVLRV